MSEENKKLVRRWFEEVWNQQSEEAIDEMFAPGGKAYGFPDRALCWSDPRASKAYTAYSLGPFPTFGSRCGKLLRKVTESRSHGLQP